MTVQRPLRDGRTTRLAAIAILVCLQFGLLVWFGGVGYGGEPFPGGAELSIDTEAYVGEEAVVYGQVIETEPLTLEYDDDGRIVEFRVTGVRTSVEEGQYLEVYATVRDDGSLAAIETVAYAERGHWYAYGISALAAVITGYRLLAHWTVDRRTFGLKPR
ncbi:hypothetical protein [Haloplanus pelagicus]|uniref:hypothetical protein n=1 Tax=Haloplanus pelagicus TaxID=2949995 RepID=UPI0020407D50|nr:hypothetical protein [Haloplanus sp. HW8-1]